MRLCLNCGRDLEDHVVFCDYCGAQQPRPQRQASTQPYYWPPQQLEQEHEQARRIGKTQVNASRFIMTLCLIGLLTGLAGFAAGALTFSGQQMTTTQRLTTTQQLTTISTVLSLQHVTILSTTTAVVQQLGAAGLVEYAFTPGGNCAGVVIKWIQKANNTIHVMIYSFTLDNIRDALIQAKNRGVDVKVVMDREQTASNQGTEYQALKNAGVDVRLGSSSRDVHHKVAIIDGHIIITGSFNWSKAGNEDNNENLVVLDNQTWATSYEEQFQRIYSIAT